MLKKKLLTIAGVLGILACGACFLPPIMDRQPTAPPPPPPLPDLNGIHTLRVAITARSIPEHIDIESASAEVASYINRFAANRGIEARAGNEPADAALQIDIADENATLVKVWPSDKTESWNFSFLFTAVLRRQNGSIVYQKMNRRIQIPIVLQPGHADDVWSIPEARQRYVAYIQHAATQGIFF